MFPVLIDAGWQSEAVGFTPAKGSDMIGAVERLTAWIMKVSLGAVGNDLSCYKICPSNPICIRGLRVHILFCSFNFLGVLFFTVYYWAASTDDKPWLYLTEVTAWYAKQNSSEKDKVCSLKIGCSRKGVKKCVMFLTWQMHCLAWWHWAWQCVWLPGHLLGLCVSKVMPRAASSFCFPMSFPESFVAKHTRKDNEIIILKQGEK